MGNDGGSIPKRRELVKEAARLPTTSELKATALESLTHAWTTCPISSEPLDPHNTVSDSRGRLYNYETVLRCLMPSADANEPAAEEKQSQEAAEFARSGIRSLKDVVKLRFNIRKDEKRGEIRTCPLSMKELGPSTRAVYVVPCGHVFTEIVVRELLAAEESSGADAAPEKRSNCPECSEAFPLRDLVPILPVDEADVEKCTARIEALRTAGLAHNLKKDKSAGGKKKRKAAEEEDGKAHENGANGDKPVQKEKKQKKDRGDISSRINNSMTATLTAKVLAEQDERNKQRKLAAAVR
ncbi:Rtf2 RING-finger-domain-containing protein [Xylaria bambusicola]|uniref:Rtf2 RING-finger-domain-containing protein n=1 Tax=Xylaria bambusicola TaxID=326684 RepID=UPI0020084DF8|nr:Rtf2 RING-finger-domain-containing protein [Xylaria bambusicola]KAI0517913.1 Rtf2 RING-finger-domain-containing protein [Xylaria bambusicola]